MRGLISLLFFFFSFYSPIEQFIFIQIRSLYTDVLFALVKGAAERRMGSLKVIITSATLNV